MQGYRDAGRKGKGERGVEREVRNRKSEVSGKGKKIIRLEDEKSSVIV
jgi:hypothetical protein